MNALRMVFLMCTVMIFGGCGLSDIQAQNQNIEAENMRVYGIYQSYMKSMNEHRENSGIPPEPIKPFDEWQRSPGTK